MDVTIIRPFTRCLKGKEQEVIDLYFNKNCSVLFLTQYYGCSSDVFRNFFKNNNLKTRSAKEQNALPKTDVELSNNKKYGDYNFEHPTLIGKDDEVLRLYENEGYSKHEIANKFGVNEGTIQVWMFRNGVKMRNPKEARNHPRYYEKQRDQLKYKFSTEIVEKVIKEYNEGHGAKYIAEKMGLDSSVIKRILKENGIQLRVGVETHTDKKKEKFANTIFKKFGGWKGRHDIQKQKSLEKYGVENPMQLSDTFHKQQESAKKFKTVIVEGVEIVYQGYELRGIYRLLSEGYFIHDIKIGRNQVPSFRYFYDGKMRVYYPDIYIPKDNRIVEVKSQWTYENWLDQNLAKKQAVLDAGYLFDFYIM